MSFLASRVRHTATALNAWITTPRYKGSPYFKGLLHAGDFLRFISSPHFKNSSHLSRSLRLATLRPKRGGRIHHMRDARRWLTTLQEVRHTKTRCQHHCPPSPGVKFAVCQLFARERFAMLQGIGTLCGTVVTLARSHNSHFGSVPPSSLPSISKEWNGPSSPCANVSPAQGKVHLASKSSPHYSSVPASSLPSTSISKMRESSSTSGCVSSSDFCMLRNWTWMNKVDWHKTKIIIASE